MAGLRAVRDRGRTGGRPALNDEQKAMVETMLKNPALSVVGIAAAVGVSPGNALSSVSERSS
jgi:hypothetical protein